jgi:hypothetical protein
MTASSGQSQLTLRTRPITVGVVALLASLACACSGEQRASTAAPSPLVGRWIRVYPPDGALDTLELHADGTASGPESGRYVGNYAPEKWMTEDELMPGGLCVGKGPQADGKRFWNCVGFRLAGDTLSLADGRQTVFLRAPTDGRLVVTAWTSPGPEVHAPRVGDTVHGIVPTPGR